ncbi:MAG: chemotaxis protein CheA [Vicinamibacterales bacterium]
MTFEQISRDIDTTVNQYACGKGGDGQPAHQAMLAQVDTPVGADDLHALPADPEVAALFIAEALDHLGTIETALLALDQRPGDVALVNEIFRLFHTLKGNAGALGVHSVQELAHRVESLLDLARSGHHRMGSTEVDLVLRAVDALTLMIGDISRRLKGRPAADLAATRHALIEQIERVIADATARRPASDTDDAPPVSCAESVSRRCDDRPGRTVIRIDSRKLDDLDAAVGALVVVQARIQEHAELAALAGGEAACSLGQLAGITAELQRVAMTLRTVPIRHAFQKVARVVRDLSRNTGKPVELVLSGEDTELDRSVVEEITDPLLHMARNSMDHGMETGSVRKGAGKSVRGRLALSACHQDGHVVLEIADDGAGLNTEKIRETAISCGLLDPLATPTPQEINMLIFAPGLSTADKVTKISGRGVGMDVVRRNVEALRGRIDIRSEPGKGTTFQITLPLTLAGLNRPIVAARRAPSPARESRSSLSRDLIMRPN